MNKAKLGIVVIAAVFLFLSLGHCQALSDKERGIYYDSAWRMLQAEYQVETGSYQEAEDVEAIVQQLLDENNLTQDQLEDIIERGNAMPFTATEEELAQELEKKTTENLTPDETMAALRALADKYGMNIGQASSVFTRTISNPD